MNTNPRRRVGVAAVFASAVAAGIIASSSGKAIVAPMPRRNVRRGINFLVRIADDRLERDAGFMDIRLAQNGGDCIKENHSRTTNRPQTTKGRRPVTR